MKGLRLAISFLTRVPAAGNTAFAENDFRRSFIYFPVVGLIGGCLAYLTARSLVVAGAGVGAAAFGAMITLFLFTGGLHTDGLADTADGFMGGKGKEDTLRIMKDTQTGAFGAAAVALAAVGMYSALESDIISGNLKTIVAVHVFSRWCMAAACYGSLYPRVAGTAHKFVGNIGLTELLLATAMALTFGYIAIGMAVIYMLLVSAAITAVIRLLSSRKIGGITGDVLGAVNETSALIMQFVF